MPLMAAVTATGGGRPALKGFVNTYSWYWLEPSKGVYNWSLIDADLAALAALSAKYGVDFKLIIKFTFEATANQRLPSVPQPTPYTSGASSYRGMLPDYIIASGNIAVNPGGTGYEAAWWRSEVYTRYNTLIAAAGARYDANPHVEMFMPILETGVAIATLPGDYTPAAAVAAFNSIVAATAAAWPTTVKVFNSNWNPTGTGINDLLSASQNAVANGFGFGGPDILYPPQQAETFGSQILRGAGGSFGSIDYRGTVASAYQEEADYSNWTNETSVGVEAYTYNTLKSTHVLWSDHGTYGNSYGASGDNWSDVVAALQAQSFRIHSACPTNYSGGCNTN